MSSVDYLPALVDASSSTNPLPFTSSPPALVQSDIKLFFKELGYAWGIVAPVCSYGSGKLDELYPSFENVKAMLLHGILIVSQGFFILTMPFWVLHPLPLSVLVVYVVMFWMFNKMISNWLNGDGRPLTSRVPMDGWEKHEGEKWIFMNGVAAGQHWLQCNIDRLAMTFRREVIGIHNLTAGILFDIIQCLIERDFCYNTEDSRQAYRAVKAALRDPTNTKVVVILHSQGAIEGSLMIDWLLADLPRVLFQKLEIYTFGAAANHFNNPTVTDVLAQSPVCNPRSSAREEPIKRVIGHIEHYANQGDFVARWGVLNFSKGLGYRNNRFVGQVFERKDASGHQMCQHYLDHMFEWEEEGVVAENNAFMDSVMNVDGVVAGEREHGNAETGPVDGVGEGIRVRELSRLWKYRNGMSPAD